MLPGFAQDSGTIVERVGLDAARELWSLSQSGVDYVRETIADAHMEAMDHGDGWLHVSKTDRASALQDEAELHRNLGADVEFWPASLVRSKLKSDTYFQAVHFPTAFSIHPLNYALGLAALAEQSGARIFENTPALSIDPAGVRKRISTATGRIRASHIVLAGNTHIGALMPQLSKTLIPVHSFVIVTKPLGPELAETIDYPGSVSDTDRADSHYRIVGGDRLMWAGRMTVWDAKPGRFGRRLLRDLRRRFPQLNAAEVDYAWTGELGMTVHRMPQIGELSPGVWLASGFGGHGLNTTAMAGNLIARALVEGDDRWRQFQPFELVWAGGRTGRILDAGRLLGAARIREMGLEARAQKRIVSHSHGADPEEARGGGSRACSPACRTRGSRSGGPRRSRPHQGRAGCRDRPHQGGAARRSRTPEGRAARRSQGGEGADRSGESEAKRLEAERIAAEKAATEAAHRQAERVAAEVAVASRKVTWPRATRRRSAGQPDAEQGNKESGWFGRGWISRRRRHHRLHRSFRRCRR